MADDRTQRSRFAGSKRTLNAENEIVLTSVGIDIGSATTHLAFARITMARDGTRYVVDKREPLFESALVLTPYTHGDEIDAQKLGQFVDSQYAAAGIDVEQIDTGALILTGVAARRHNARAIGEALARTAGKLVALSAGDALEAMLIAHGSGAVAVSRETGKRIMAVDVGGGTSKIAVCEGGAIVDTTVLDVGARIVRFDADGRVLGVEAAGERVARDISVALDSMLAPADIERISEHVADILFGAMRAEELDPRYLRLPPLQSPQRPDLVVFSGGVAEYLHGREQRTFGDFGPELATAIHSRCTAWGVERADWARGIRATVLGASQYTAQLSGSTIFVSHPDVLPLRNAMALRLPLDLETDDIDAHWVSRATQRALATTGNDGLQAQLALCFAWHGTASYDRLDAVCRGIVAGFGARLKRDDILIVVTDRDVGGLLGMHLHDECGVENPIVSIDGIDLGTLDFIDIGGVVETSGAVPVVVKSLQFGATTLDLAAALGPRK